MKTISSLGSLILKFIYVGLTSVGGGLVTISVLLKEFVDTGIISMKEFYSMVAISEATPGPLGINIATFVGYQVQGVFGAIVTSFALVLPSVILAYIVSMLYDKIKDSIVIKKMMLGLRVAVIGLIASATLTLVPGVVLEDPNANVSLSNISYKSFIIILIISLIYWKYKGSFIKYIGLGIVFGTLMYFI